MHLLTLIYPLSPPLPETESLPLRAGIWSPSICFASSVPDRAVTQSVSEQRMQEGSIREKHGDPQDTPWTRNQEKRGFSPCSPLITVCLLLAGRFSPSFISKARRVHPLHWETLVKARRPFGGVSCFLGKVCFPGPVLLISSPPGPPPFQYLMRQLNYLTCECSGPEFEGQIR